MSDRYDEAMRALRDTPVPDQWDEIATRTDEGGPLMPLDDANGSRTNGSPRRWPMVLAAAASVIAIAGVVVLFTRDDPDVTTDLPAAAESTEPPSTLEPTPSTSTTESSPTAGPNVADLGNYPVSTCRGIVLATTSAPSGVDDVQVAPNPNDPRLPVSVHTDLIGMFPSELATKAMFVIAGWPGLNDDSGTTTSGPFPGTESWISPYDDGWLAEVAVPLGADTRCPATLVGVGFNEADFRAFLTGLTLEG